MSNHRIVFDTRTHYNTRNKMDILAERRDFLASELARAIDYIEGLKVTHFGRPCAGCGTLLETEADFAAHFTVRDETYLNLGNCYHKD